MLRKEILLAKTGKETLFNHRLVATADIVDGCVDSGKNYPIDNYDFFMPTIYGDDIAWELSPIDEGKFIFTQCDRSQFSSYDPDSDYMQDAGVSIFGGEANYANEAPYTLFPSKGTVYFEVFAENASGGTVSVPLKECVVDLSVMNLVYCEGEFSVGNASISGAVTKVTENPPTDNLLCNVSVVTKDGVALSKDFYCFSFAHCFSGNTEVLMADGSIKLAKDIRVGDMVKVWDFDNGCYSEAPLFWVKKREVSPMYQRIVTNTGRVLKQINNHRMFSLTNNTFEQCQSILGHKVWTVDGEETVVSAEFVHEPIEYYNAVSHHHMNLICNGFLTSCRFNNLYPIKDMKFIKEERLVRRREEFNVPDSWFYGVRLSETTKTAEEVEEYVRTHEAVSA